MTDVKCKATVWDRESRWLRSYPCTRKAVTAAGYCKQHDPELRSARAASRGPTQWERYWALRSFLGAEFERRFGKDSTRLLHLYANERAVPDVVDPIPQWIIDVLDSMSEGGRA